MKSGVFGLGLAALAMASVAPGAGLVLAAAALGLASDGSSKRLGPLVSAAAMLLTGAGAAADSLLPPRPDGLSRVELRGGDGTLAATIEPCVAGGVHGMFVTAVSNFDAKPIPYEGRMLEVKGGGPFQAIQHSCEFLAMMAKASGLLPDGATVSIPPPGPGGTSYIDPRSATVVVGEHDEGQTTPAWALAAGRKALRGAHHTLKCALERMSMFPAPLSEDHHDSSNTIGVILSNVTALRKNQDGNPVTKYKTNTFSVAIPPDCRSPNTTATEVTSAGTKPSPTRTAGG